jgi:hypothetical protein
VGSWPHVEQWEFRPRHPKFEHHAFWYRQENVCRYYIDIKFYVFVHTPNLSKMQTFAIREDECCKGLKTWCFLTPRDKIKVKGSNWSSLIFMEVLLLWP